eukprot:7780330-Ditylum_brightwellii.AAC.1
MDLGGNILQDILSLFCSIAAELGSEHDIMDGCLYLDNLQEEVEAAAAASVAGPSTNADTKNDEVVSDSPRESYRETPVPACLSFPPAQQRQQQQQNQLSSCVWRPAWPQLTLWMSLHWSDFVLL